MAPCTIPESDGETKSETVENESHENMDKVSPEELKERFKKLKNDSFEVRWKAIHQILNLDRCSIPVIKAQLLKPPRASGESMKRILYRLRKDLKEEKIKSLLSKGIKPTEDKIVRDSPPEFLKVLVERKRNDDPLGWRYAVEKLTLLVTLTSIGTTEAILIVIDYAPENEAAFRKEIYQLLLWAGESAIPAAILRQETEDEDIKIVVNTFLKKFNMMSPGTQVRVKNPSILAQILRVFAKKKQFDAMDTIAQFINSPNPIVRNSARDSLAKFGRNAKWALKKQYINITGKKPDPSWGHEQIAQKLYEMVDQQRLAPFNKKLEEGLKYAKEHKYEKMEKVFKEILAIDPMYDRRSEMVDGYLLAIKYYIRRGKLEKAHSMLTVVRRINEDPERNNKILSLIYYVEGLLNLTEGIADPYMMKKAISLDPSFKDAKAMLKKIERIYRGRVIRGYRLLAITGIGITSVGLIILIIIIQTGRNRKGAYVKNN